MSDCFGIPTRDGYLCNMRDHTIRKRTKEDLFTKTFHVNLPGSNTSRLPEMEEFIHNFACEREELATFLKQT